MNYTKPEIAGVIKKLEIRKVGTRREDIINLLETLNQKNHDEIYDGGMQVWLQTWVFPKLFRLIPELKKIDALERGGEHGK